MTTQAIERINSKETVTLNNLVDNKILQEFIVSIGDKTKKEDLLNKFSTLKLDIKGKPISFIELIRSIDPINNVNNNLSFNIEGQEYIVKSGDNLIKLIQASAYIIGENTVQFLNGKPASEQIDGKLGEATAKGIINLQTRLTLREEFVGAIAVGAELDTRKTKPSIDRSKERNYILDYDKKGADLNISSYGEKSILDLDTSKIFFIFNGQKMEIPYNLVLVKDKFGKVNETDEHNKLNIKEAISFMNSIHLIYKDFIKNNPLTLEKPFYKSKNTINMVGQIMLFPIPVTLIEKLFIDNHTLKNSINYDELVKFLDNLYLLTHPQKTQEVIYQNTTIIPNVTGSNPGLEIKTNTSRK